MSTNVRLFLSHNKEIMHSFDLRSNNDPPGAIHDPLLYACAIQT